MPWTTRQNHETLKHIQKPGHMDVLRIEKPDMSFKQRKTQQKPPISHGGGMRRHEAAWGGSGPNWVVLPSKVWHFLEPLEPELLELSLCQRQSPLWHRCFLPSASACNLHGNIWQLKDVSIQINTNHFNVDAVNASEQPCRNVRKKKHT